MSMSTMSTIFSENAEQTSSTEFSDELTTALAVGRWWAIMEVSCPISEEPEYGDLISGQWGETVRAGETAYPTSLVFSNASEKAQRRSQHSGFSNATLKTTKQWRQKTVQGAPFSAKSKQGAPVPASYEKGDLITKQWRQNTIQGAPFAAKSKQGAPVPAMAKQGASVPASSENGDLTSSLVFSDSTEKSPNSDLSNATLNTMEQQRNQREKKHQGQAKAAGSEKTEGGNLISFPVFSDASEKAMKQHEEAPVPVGSPQGTPVPTGSPRGPPERLRQELSLQGAPMPDKIPNSQKLKIPELLKRELLQQKPLASPLKTAPVSCAQGEPVIDKISEKRNLKNSELQRKKLLEKDAIIPGTTPMGAPVHVGTQQGEAGSPEGAAVPTYTKKPQASCALVQTLPGTPITSPQGAPIFPRLRAPITSPQGAPIFPRLRAPITSPQGAPMPSQRKRVCPWSTAASDNADLCHSPSQKLCVDIDNLIEKVQLILKLDSYNHQAPLIATSQLNQGTLSSLQPWKIALDNAGVGQSLPQKSSLWKSKSKSNSRSQAS